MRNRILQYCGQNDRKPPVIVRNSTETGVDLLLYDMIDPWFGCSAAAVADALKQADGADITVRINSPGGDAFEGRAIASQIRSYQGKTRCIVDGYAASAASTIAIACGSVTMAAGSFLMIHRASAFTGGDADELQAMAALLVKLDAELAADYARKCGCTTAQAAAWMAAETWFTAAEAVAAGLADAEATDAATFQAWNLAGFRHAPEALAAIMAQRSAPVPDLAAELAGVRAGLERRLSLFSLPA